MGKRKSSPRLATTSVRDAVTNSMTIKYGSIHCKWNFPLSNCECRKFYGRIFEKLNIEEIW